MTVPLALVIGIPVAAGIGWFAWQSWKASKETAAIEAEEKAMEAEMRTDAIDDAFAHQVAKARDGGA